MDTTTSPKRSIFSRRQGLALAAGAITASAWPRSPAAAAAEPRLFDLAAVFKQPVRLKSLELLRVGDDHVVRATSEDGVQGHAVTNQHAGYLQPMFKQRVAAYFVGKDVRDIEGLIDGAHVFNSNYKLVGVPLWICISWAEFAVLDLLGQLAKKPVAALLGGKPLRQTVPMYLSSTDRASTPEQEVALFERTLAATGSRACKYKVGGRMSGNEDASPGRTRTLIGLMRKRLGEGITLYADANGSFDVAHGIEVGRMLEAHDVAIFEEPCPFEDYEATRKVTRALKRIMVAGGEQDSSFYRFRDIVQGRVLDMVQPDLSYNGGFVRTTRVARLAARAGIPISPHCPNASTMLYTLHLAAFTPNMGPFQEHHVRLVGRIPWYAQNLSLRDGRLAIPTEPGFGFTLDPALLAKAVVV